MDFSLTENQELIKRTARDFMDRECTKDTLLDMELSDKGVSDTAWTSAAEIGWHGMLIPEQYEGSGNSMTDIAVVFEQLGSGPLSGPFLSSSVLGASVILECGSDEQKQSLLPGIATGQAIIVLALTEPEYGWESDSINMRAESRNNSFLLNGSKLFVHDAASADKLICVVRTADSTQSQLGISLLIVDASAPGVSIRSIPGFLGWNCEVTFRSVEVPHTALLGNINQGWEPLQKGIERTTPILCAYQVGGIQSVFDMTVDYSRSRKQFGQTIGRFQRVQDHIINIVNDLDAARWTTYEALWKLDTGQPAEASIHLAKSIATNAYYQACNASHEVHAGVGVSREYGLTLHTKMSRSLYHYLGDPKYHLTKLGEVLEL